MILLELIIKIMEFGTDILLKMGFQKNVSKLPGGGHFEFGRHNGFWSRNKKHPYQNLILI